MFINLLHIKICECIFIFFLACNLPNFPNDLSKMKLYSMGVFDILENMENIGEHRM